MKLLQAIVLAAAAAVAAPVAAPPHDSRWDELSPLVEPASPPPSGAVEGVVLAVDDGHGLKGLRPAWVQVISNPSYVRPMANHPAGGKEYKWRPSGRLGAVLDKLGISPVVEWSHRPGKAAAAYAAAVESHHEGKPNHAHHGHHGHHTHSAHGAPVSISHAEEKPRTHCRPFAAIGARIRALYNSLADQRTYATVMLLVALMNLGTIALVLLYFNMRGRERARARREARHLETAASQEKQ